MQAIILDAQTVQKRWQQWQRVNPAEAAEICRKFGDMMIFGNSARAIAWHSRIVAEKTGATIAEVREAIHQLDERG